jgi:Damage-control phosphatase ARMT1-like domain
VDAIPADGSTIRCNRPGSYPWSVLHDRHPVLLGQVAGGRPYPPDVAAALARLGRESQDAGWYELSFLAAENLLYAGLLEAVGYHRPGAWQFVDPFAPMKAAELGGSGADDELAVLDELSTRPDDAQFGALVLASLWGNRADLGFLINAGPGEPDGRRDDVLVDDRPALDPRLDGGTVTVVADNAGRELLADLALIDHLLRTGRASSIVLHVKPAPYFVSDATMSDVLSALRRMTAAATPAARAVGARLTTALRNGVLTVRTDPFWFTPRPYTEMPPALEGELAASRLIIVKGDLNYRRLVQDRHWPATASFADLTAYFPGPVLALRTCKSEVMVGLDAATVERLDTAGDGWRTSGDYGLIQLSPGRAGY